MRHSSFLHRGQPSLLILFLSLGHLVSAQPVFKYSSADKALITRTRKEEKKAEDDYDRRDMYRIARVYENLYNRYKDTSMTAAIRCYRFACQTEGDLDPYQHKAAYALAQIYETGKGTPTNREEALIFYFLSYDLGKKKMEQLKPIACANVRWLNPGEGSLSPADSLVFSLSPFCSVMKAEFQPQWKRIADLLREKPSLSLEVSTSWKMVLIAAPYDLLFQQEYFRQSQALQQYLIAVEGISADRLQRIYIPAPGDSDQIVIRFTTETNEPAPPQPKLRRDQLN